MTKLPRDDAPVDPSFIILLYPRTRTDGALGWEGMRWAVIACVIFSSFLSGFFLLAVLGSYTLVFFVSRSQE